jgi:hypothetical protein
VNERVNTRNRGISLRSQMMNENWVVDVGCRGNRLHHIIRGNSARYKTIVFSMEEALSIKVENLLKSGCL